LIDGKVPKISILLSSKIMGLNGWMSGWVDGWMGGWVDGWMLELGTWNLATFFLHISFTSSHLPSPFFQISILH